MGFGTKMINLGNVIRSISGLTDNLTIDEMADALSNASYIIPNFDSDSLPVWCEDKALEALYVAETYYWNRISGNRSYTYSNDNIVNEGTNSVNDSSGNANLDCSAYIHLVMMGITYEKSPFATLTSTSDTYSSSNLAVNSDYTWSDNGLQYSSFMISNSNTTGYVRTAADLAKYYYLQGRCFSDPSLVEPGDLLFCNGNTTNGRFMNVSHVGIIENSKDHFYNVTSGTGVLLRSSINLDDLNNTSNGNARSDVIFFARPDYETERTYTFDTTFNRTKFPYTVTTNTINNVTTTANSDNTLTVSSSGATGTCSQYVFLYSIYLEPGTYHLSGCPACSDRRSVCGYKYWGLTLDESEGTALTYTTYGLTSSSSTSTTSSEVSNQYIWDNGYGADFTLSEGHRFYMRIYVSQYAKNSSTAYDETTTWSPSVVRTA